MHFRSACPLALLAVTMLSITPPLSRITVAETEGTAVGPSRSLLQDTLAPGNGSSTSSISSQVQGPEQPPGTSYQISGDEIRRLAARGAEDVTALQAGVVLDRSTNNLYVRGGGASGMIYYVDGVPLQDAFSGISSARLSNAAINEMSVVTGGLGVGYGRGMSGATSITTPDGSGRFHGTAEAITDNFHGGRYDYNVYGLSLNGPLVPNSDRLTFSAAGERGWMGDRQPRANAGGILPHNSSGTWTWNGKLRWKPTERIVARVGALGSSADWKEYMRSYAFDINHAPRTTVRNSAFWGEVTHSLSPRTFYTVHGYCARQEQKTGDGVYFDNLWGYGRPNGNPRYDVTTLFWDWDDMRLDPDSLAQGVIYQLHTPVVDTVLNVRLPSGDTIQKSFVASGDEGSVWEDYLRQKQSYIGGRIDLVSQIHAHHALKLGAEFQRHTLRYYHHPFPQTIYRGADDGPRYADFYGFDEFGSNEVDSSWNGAKHPINAAAYAEDRITLEDLTVSGGLRLDYFDYRAYALRDPRRTPPRRLTRADVVMTKALVRLSPRLGAEFRIPGGPQLHIAAGKHYQRPDLSTVYMNNDLLVFMRSATPFPYLLSNPRLKPLETISYEVGVRQRVDDFITAGATGFQRDSRNVVQSDWQFAEMDAYQMYSNRAAVTSKGAEFQLSMRRRWGITGQLTYTIQKAEESLYYWSGIVVWSNNSPVRVTGPVGYDSRRKFTAIIDARFGKREGPRLGGGYPLERSGVNFVFNAASGFPYAPTHVYNEVSSRGLTPDPSGSFGSSTIPATYRLDMKIDKAIPFNGVTVGFYFWVLNVFNRTNVLDVYRGTGKPDDTGWLDTDEGRNYISQYSNVTDNSRMTGEQKYRFRENDPLNYDTPRQIRLGMQVTF